MNVPQGRLAFAGYDADGGFQVSRTASTVADPIQGKFVLGVNLPRYGDIWIYYGALARRLSNCRVVRQTITQGGNGRWKDVQFEDRRWVWRYRNIYGQYNGFVKGVKQEQKTVRQLATLCLNAMGEFNVDVSVLPADVYPIADFGGQLASEQLESLIQPFGCIVTLDWNDAVRIVEMGSGSNPPRDSRIMDFTQAYEPPIIPETLRIEGAPIKFQRDLPLESVGYEVDTFEVKKLDDLSYGQPLGIFAQCTPQFNKLTDPKLRELAISCIWKLYRIQGNGTEVINMPVPTGSTLDQSVWRLHLTEDTDIARILPISDDQVSLWTGQSIPAEIIGYFHDGKSGQHNNVDPVPGASWNSDWFANIQGNSLRNTYKSSIYQHSFEIDEEKGYVKFGVATYRISRNGNVIDPFKRYPAKILLRTSFILRHPDTNEPIRAFYDYKPNSPFVVRGLVHTVRVEELEYECGVGSQTDKTAFERKARTYALKEIAKYQLGDSVSVPVKGFIFDYFPDGSINAIRLERSDSGEATTNIDWQAENPVERLTYDEKVRRLQELANNKFIANQRAVLARSQARRATRKTR